MSKASILMITSEYRAFGGVETVMNNLCIGLNKIGFETAIGAFSFQDSPPDDIKKINLKYGNLKNNPYGRNYDIVHSHQPRMNFFSLFTPKPFLSHYHGTVNKIQSLSFVTSMLLCRHRLSKIISISHAANNQAKKLLKNFKSEIIYNGIDTEFYNENLPRPYTEGTPQLLFVSNLYPHKNADKIINDMPDILRFYPNAHLQIVGEGKSFRKLNENIHIKKLEKHVKLLGRISKDELRLRYSSCDVYVSASKWEMFDLTALEAMACGKPVVLSDIEVHREIMGKAKAGSLFSLNDSKDFSKKVIEVYEKRKNFGKAGIDFVKLHDWSDSCKRLANVYEQLILTKKD